MMPKLTKNQQDTADKIIRIGREMGKNDTQIQTAIKVGYIESSLGDNKGKNPDSTARGLYQYLDGTWKSHQGDRDNDEDSIRAFYKDMQIFDNRYAQHQADSKKDPEGYNKRPSESRVPADVTREEYIYTKHHDGPNASAGSFNRDGDMGKGINIYNDRASRPNGANEVAEEVMKGSKGSADTQPQTPQVPAQKPQPVVEAPPAVQVPVEKPRAQYPGSEDDERTLTQKPATASIMDYFRKGAAEVEDTFSFIWRK